MDIDFLRPLQTGLARATCLLLAAALGSAAFGQAKPPAPEVETPASFGTVSGHVYIAGSNAPARLVNVALQPIQVELPGRPQSGIGEKLSFVLHQTNLDGEYVIPRVRPGTYYVLVNAPGMFSPFTQFTAEEMAHPTPGVAKQIADTLPVVAVRPNSTAVLDVHLERGAGMSGIVRFDDGTPFMNASLIVERHRSDGKWVSPQINYSRTTADVDGHWQISGLGPGEYRVRVSLELSERYQSALLGNSISSSSTTLYTLRYYSGDTVRERDAKSIKLEEGQQASGEDITIPVSKLHPVSGALVDAQTGQPLNAGNVELVYADTGESLNSVKVDPETRSFMFFFVPEALYKLRTGDGREVRFEEPADPLKEALNPRKATTLRSYGPGELTLAVEGETTGVRLPLKARTQSQ